ncbi:putative orfan [Tupanvirus soda lake]|uniref:Orfan n=2 Tax=Tupanvirus TaxID=2094720 RepID=A0AC62AB13_9VIRU|nr:putative orfan [Tupanvirus soda lake]QKU34929.1 putative orfan [Tupanvirus soda lake]
MIQTVNYYIIMSSNILDLDIFRSIKQLGIGINTKYMHDLIYGLVDMVKRFGKYNGVIHRDIGDIVQYILPIKYLGYTLTITFEYDNSYQFINIVYYNDDQSKTYLKLFLSINDEPTIKYIENDRSGYVPSYSDEKINLKPGEYLINLAHCILSFIGFHRARLDDDSYLITHNNDGELRTKLWLYYCIKHGKSWYSKFGYEPGNCSAHEFNFILNDVRKIKLCEITECLNKLLNAPNAKYIDQSLIMTSDILIRHINDSKESLYEYTLNHTLEEFTILTNNLSQSMYSRNISIEIKSENNIPECDGNIKYSKDDKCSDDEYSDDEDLDYEKCYYQLSFPWFNTIKKLLIANVIQINNDIGDHFYHLQK